MSRTPRRESSRTARRTRLALVGLSVLLVTACGSGPVRSGAAATVGDARVEVAQMQQVVDRALADPQAAQQLGADRQAFQRQVLARLVNREILAVAARNEGVTVSDGEVDQRMLQFARQLGGREQLVQQAAQSGIAEPDLRPFVRDLVLHDKVADRLTAGQQVSPARLRSLYEQGIAQYDQVVARHVLVRDRAQAQRVLTTVRTDQRRFPALAAQFSLDEGSKARGGELEPAGRGAYVPEFERALFSMREGEIRLVQTQFGFHVVQLLDRRTTTLAQATPDLRRQALQPQREAAVGELLRRTAAKLGVSVNPRFGRWDGEQGTVAERTSDVSSPAPAEDGEPLLQEEGQPQQAPDQQAPDQQAPDQQAPEQQAPEQQPDQQAPEQQQAPAPAPTAGS